MYLKLEDIFDFSFLSLAILISFYVGKLNEFMSLITFDSISNFLSLSIQFMVLLGLYYKMKKFRKK
jgi:hypothetical protein